MRKVQEITPFLLNAYPHPYSEKYVRVNDDFDRCPNCDTDLAEHIRVDEKRAGALCLRCGEEYNLLDEDEKERREYEERCKQHAREVDRLDYARELRHDQLTEERIDAWRGQP